MRKQSQVNGIDQIFNKIIGENFPNYKKTYSNRLKKKEL